MTCCACSDGRRHRHLGLGSPTETSPIELDPISRLDATVHELGALAQYFLVGSAS